MFTSVFFVLILKQYFRSMICFSKHVFVHFVNLNLIWLVETKTLKEKHHIFFFFFYNISCEPHSSDAWFVYARSPPPWSVPCRSWRRRRARAVGDQGRRAWTWTISGFHGISRICWMTSDHIPIFLLISYCIYIIIVYENGSISEMILGTGISVFDCFFWKTCDTCFWDLEKLKKNMKHVTEFDVTKSGCLVVLAADGPRRSPVPGER